MTNDPFDNQESLNDSFEKGLLYCELFPCLSERPA